MSKYALKNASIVVNGVDFTDHVGQVVITMKAKSLDTTNFSSGGGTEAIQGLREDEFQIDFHQDFASAQVDQTLSPLFANGTEFTVVVKPFNTAVSLTNPSYTATCLLMEYTPMSGKVGDLSKLSLKLPTQRTGITRATS